MFFNFRKFLILDMRFYHNLIKATTVVKHPFLLIIRLYWGYLLFVTGLGKLLETKSIAHFFATLDIPYPFFATYAVGAIEILGGISLFLGLFSRLMALPLIALFLAAYATAHGDALANIFANPTLFISESPFLFLYTAVVVLCFGPGMFSFDYWAEKEI